MPYANCHRQRDSPLTLIGSLLRPALLASAMAAYLQVNISLSTAQTDPFIDEYAMPDTSAGD